MGGWYFDGCVLADRNVALAAILTVDAYGDLGIAACRTAKIIHAEGNLGILADDVEAGRAHHGEVAVAFPRRSRQQHVERSTEVEGFRIRRVVHLAVRDDDGGGNAIGRGV